MVRRERSAKETTFLVIKGLAAAFCLPAFFLLACIFTIAYSVGYVGDEGNHSGTWALLFWALFLGPIIWRLTTVRKRRRTLKGIVALYEGEFFNPQQVITEGWQTYLGVDAIRGTMLFVNMTREGVYDVMGLDMNSWTRVRREDATVKLNTKIPECPYIEITAPGGKNDAIRLYDFVCAMEHRVYEYKVTFPTFVKNRTQEGQPSVTPGIHLNCFA